MTTGEKIVKRRKELLMTQTQLSEESGINIIRLLRIEKNRAAVKAEEWGPLFKALHVESFENIR